MTDFLAQTRLDDRVAIVTGAGSGLGRATAHALAQAGAIVAVTDIDGAAAGKVADEIGGNSAVAHVLDITQDDEVDTTVEEIFARYGRIDILVNNAGIGLRLPTVDMDTESWNRVMDINLNGHFYCARAVGRRMVPAGSGAIVMVSSIMGLTGGGMYPNPSYHATKGAIVNLVRSLGVEWAQSGVRVNAVAPTYVRTNLTDRMLQDDETLQYILDNTPMNRLGEADEIASAILFLVSDAASLITGHTLPVDGGWVAR